MYKKFKSIKEGDILYCIEINIDNYTFQKLIVENIIPDNDYLEVYVDKSPLSFDFKKNQSSWHKLIFTTREEALKQIERKSNENIKYFEKNIKKFRKLIRNINDIEFK